MDAPLAQLHVPDHIYVFGFNGTRDEATGAEWKFKLSGQHTARAHIDKKSGKSSATTVSELSGSV